MSYSETKANSSASSTAPTGEPLPLPCRRPVRLAMYLGLAAFFVGMIAWGIVPGLLDPTFEQHIKDKQVIAGMTREQALEAWGSPYQMNVSYTPKGIRREEWVFEDWKDASTISHRYLYFDEGVWSGAGITNSLIDEMIISINFQQALGYRQLPFVMTLK